MCCAGKHRSAGFYKRHWWLLMKHCCMSAAQGKSSAAPIRAAHQHLRKARPVVLFSPAPSTHLTACGNPHTCCQTAVTAWRCGPTAQVSVAGSRTICTSTSAAGVMICCVTHMAVLFTCVWVAKMRRIPSPRTRLRTLSGITPVASWRIGFNLIPSPAM